MSDVRFTSAADVDDYRRKLIKHRRDDKTTITLCSGTGCLACGCDGVAEAFREALAASNLDREVELKRTGCHGFCERGPLVVIQPQGIFYQKLKPADARLVVEQTIKGDQLVKRLLYRDPQTK